MQLFAATTLYAKISKQWEEVPKSEYLALQTRMFEVLKSPGTSKVALPKLCQAVSINLFKFIKIIYFILVLSCLCISVSSFYNYI